MNNYKGRKPVNLTVNSILSTLITLMIGILIGYSLNSPLKSNVSNYFGNNINNSFENKPKTNFQLDSVTKTTDPLDFSTYQTIQLYSSGNRSVCSDWLTSRGEIPTLLNKLGLLGLGVEVGVRDGEFSQWILSNLKGK